MSAPNPVFQAHELGQSIWLDYLSRQIMASGKLSRMIEDQGLRGVTSNPKILAGAISGGSEYEEPIRRMTAKGKSAVEIYEALAVEDIQQAADLLHSHFEGELECDGFVSLEVSPHLAYKTRETVEEARRLWQAVDRPNVFIKVPATKQGLPAIRTLISEGVNVNVTLLFGLPRYREVTEAYVLGLEDRVLQGKPLNGIYSVASFFLSRIDTLIDPKLDELATGAQGEAAALKGEIAVASAKLAYQLYKQIFSAVRFQKLAEKGARKQWLLWGSTSTKNPEYSDLKYVEALIGPETVNTVPEDTFQAFLDHGKAEARLEEGTGEAQYTLVKLANAGIDIDQVTEQLVHEGVQKFSEPFDQLIATINERKQAA